MPGLSQVRTRPRPPRERGSPVSGSSSRAEASASMEQAVAEALHALLAAIERAADAWCEKAAQAREGLAAVEDITEGALEAG